MHREWISQAAGVIGRDWKRSIHSAYLLIFVFLCLVGGILISRFAPGSANTFLFLQMQLFLLPLFAILMGCTGFHDDMDEMPVLFSQPLFRSAYLFGKWTAASSLLAVATALAIWPHGLFQNGKSTLFFLWFYGIFLGGAFVALGICIGTLKQDRAKGLILALVVWLILIFGYAALAFFAVQTGWAARWPFLWTCLLAINPPDTFRMGFLLSSQEIPFSIPSTHQAIVWILDHLSLLTPLVCAFWIGVTLTVATGRLQRGIE